MEKYLNEALAAGIIRPSSSPAGAGFFFVKKDGPFRPCIDYRGLNNITVKNRYPLPLMTSAFEQLCGATVFIKLDLRNAYHLVRERGMNGKRHLTPLPVIGSIWSCHSNLLMRLWFSKALLTTYYVIWLTSFCLFTWTTS